MATPTKRRDGGFQKQNQDNDWRDRGKKAQAWFEDIDESWGETLGWMVNYDVDTVVDETTKVPIQVLRCCFYGQDGRDFKGNFEFRPYFYVMPEMGAEEEVELGLKSEFGEHLAEVARLEKEDLELHNHLSGIKRVLIKLSFFNVKQLTEVRQLIEPHVARNQQKSASTTFNLDDVVNANVGAGGRYSDHIIGLREYDVKYHVRVAIDAGMYVGQWYHVKARDDKFVSIKKREEFLLNAQPRICAFDIETTKQPLKFPKPDQDQVYMISWMLDGHGFLIINREIVTQDIDDFEYTPKPEYEGIFSVYNEENEEALIRLWVKMMKQQKPHVYVTYNGDYFDFPFLMIRMQLYGMDMFTELGFLERDGEVNSPYVSHLDCMHWVNRDSYLPQGSRSLKAVSKYKLGYDPLEVDAEDMLPLAREDPQRMASYSVSDAVATYYLYMKYVHPFIFSLCTIIPMSPDEVLRKGSGTLCEQLLMVMAFEKELVAPNKQIQKNERFYSGHLLDMDTYVGGHVEALQSGVFRSDVPLDFTLNPKRYQELIEDADAVYRFALEVELGVKVDDVENYDEILASTVAALVGLRDKPTRKEVPHILHLDVGAMYPNIILTNRLQPPSMVTEETCAACVYNSPEYDCKRPMKWIWRGEYFVLNKGEFNRLKTQLGSETVQTKKIENIEKQMAGKAAWKFAKRKPLFEKPGGDKKKDDWKKKKDAKVKGYEGGGTGYRRGAKDAGIEDRLREEEKRLLQQGRGGGDEEEEEDNGIAKFGDLKDTQQFALLKKRVTDYCRKAYGKIRDKKVEDRVATVCQRENSFYVDTVRLFRDRRIAYKKELKKWRGIYENVMEGTDTEHTVAECKGRLVLYESLQLAHKCILNSFYGYVMRKGSRWYSMEMAAAVTFCGASLIMMSRELVDDIGLSLELDTDGIWCCLPGSFPMDVKFKTKKGKVLKVSYPCALLNKLVEVRYENKQYQTLKAPGEYEKTTECTIFFEVDGPYKAMILPAALEEGKGIKKRYAVFEFDGTLAELKGFELKRRGELQLIKDFQAQIFNTNSLFLDGTTLEDSYGSAAQSADMCLDILYNKGSELDDDLLIQAISESSNMSRRLCDYPAEQKSTAITTGRRLADFLGDDMTKDSGLRCTFVIARKPDGQPVTTRAVPIQIFYAEREVRLHWLRRWCEDPTLGMDGDVDIRDILDWNYYIGRLEKCILKIITIPAALQKVPKNPVKRVPYPDWLKRVVAERDSKYKQTKLTDMFVRKPRVKASAPKDEAMADIEDMGKPAAPALSLKRKAESHEALAGPPPPPKAFAKMYLQDKWSGGTAVDGKAPPPGPWCASWGELFLGDAQYGGWLAHAQHTWKALATAGGQQDKKAKGQDSLPSMMKSATSSLLTTIWEVLELRQVPSDPPNQVRALVMSGDAVRAVRIEVPRRVYVNVAEAWSQELRDGYKAKEVKLTLPRNAKRHHLYELPLSAASRDTERDVLMALRADPHVLGVYESEVTATMTAQLMLGNRCKVKPAARAARDGGGKDAGRFEADELQPMYPPLAAHNQSKMQSKHHHTNTSPQHPYLTKPVHGAFLYQAASDDHRAVIALVLPHRNLARVVFVRTLVRGSVDPTLRWGAIVDDASEEAAKEQAGGESSMTLGDGVKLFGDVPAHFNVDASFVDSEAAAYRLINDELKQDLLVARRIVLLSQTQAPKQLVLQRLPEAAGVPLLTVPFNQDDVSIFTKSLQWAKDLGRRIFYRYLTARPYAAGVKEMAAYAGVPVCNLDGDAGIKALDVLWARTLREKFYVLWAAPGSVPDTGKAELTDDDIVLSSALQDASKPVMVQVSGSHHTWVVELDLLHLEVVAILAEDPGSLNFTDTSISQHFYLLREVVWTMYNQAMLQNLCADNLISDLCRWLKARSSLLYDPQLTIYVWNLTKQLFGRLLTRLTKLGCKVVYGDFHRLLLASPKSAFKECATFTNYLLTALRDQIIFKRVGLAVQAFWSEFLFVNRTNFAGIKVPPLPTHANGLVDLAGVDVDAHVKTGAVSFFWNIADRMPAVIKSRFIVFIAEYLNALSGEKRGVMAEIAGSGEPVTLASVTEKIRKRTFKRIQEKIESEWTTRALKEVHNIQVEHKQGQFDASFAEVDLGVEYIKTLCHVLGQEPQIAEAVRYMKTAVLQICGVAAHSTAAAFTPPADVFTADNVMCPYCHAISSLDLLPGGLQHPDAYRLGTVFTCTDCGQQFDKAVLESRLVHQANTLAAGYYAQDLKCSACGQPQEYDMQMRCACGMEWATTGADAAGARQQLQLLRGVAELHDMQWLHAAVSMLLAEG
eukprot:TRINITY_DN15377_c0_g2_i1.p1 TRINITY_DN15377_c0_g2~~TRINITY_DN15377_c0_g2_i1.p1  ORF type:complete len:2306 (+),score=889.51 TRINITY_DN15377_c0_g2_i1:71-6988(+)